MNYKKINIILLFSVLYVSVNAQSNNLTDDPGTNNIHTVSGFNENVGLGTTEPDRLLHLFRDGDDSSDPTTLRLEYCLPSDGQQGGGGGGSDDESCTGNIWDIYNNGSLNFEEDEVGTVLSLQNTGDAVLPLGHLKIGQSLGSSAGGLNRLLITDGRIMVGNEGVSGSLFSHLGANDLKFHRDASPSYISQMGTGTLSFVTNGDYSNVRMFIDQTGNVIMNQKVGIGTYSPTYALDVCGIIRAGRVKVENTTGWCDYVFADDYKLQSLEELETYIAENNHLPEVPSEEEVLRDGVDLGEMDKVLLKKIEELTLYVIELQKDIKKLKASN